MTQPPDSRVSGLNTLVQCPGFWLLREMDRVEDEGGGTSPAADTGTAVGRLIQLWHQGGEHAAALEAAVQQAAQEMDQEFPQADYDLARTWALAYAADPRNRNVVLPTSCELEVRGVLQADEDDPDQTHFHIEGHLDQLRRDRQGCLRVWDVKSGKLDGRDMLTAYGPQLAGYAVAVAQTLGEPCKIGGVIRVRGYVRERSPLPPHEAPVHFHSPWTDEEETCLLDTARFMLSLKRQGRILLLPGTHCNWCPGKLYPRCGGLIARRLAGGV